MRKFYVLLILIIQGNCLFSQINLLDEKNGFKSLKFHTPIKEFNIPKSQITEEHELFLYNTSDSDLKYLFNTKMDELFLSFTKNELTGILLQKNYKSRYDPEEGMRDLENLKEKFSQVLGSHNSTHESELGIGPVWIAKNVTLYLLYEVEGFKNDENGDLLVFSNIKVMFTKEGSNNSMKLSEGF